MNPEDIIKSFSMTNMLLESDLEKIERTFAIDLGRNSAEIEAEQKYYRQFSREHRLEAQFMANQYELFYCLEKSIRTLLCDVLESVHGSEWWDTDFIPPHIKGEVTKRIKREAESGITPRSSEPIDFTTFGELAEIIKVNWNIFGSVFNNQKAVEKIMANLNSLRNPIAHCSPLAEDEVLRLELSLRDWFRIME